jgi:hypothetical protein
MNYQINEITKLQTTLTSVILDRLRAAHLVSHLRTPQVYLHFLMQCTEDSLLMSVLPFMSASIKWHPLFMIVLPFMFASQVAPTLHQCPPIHACSFQVASALRECPPIHACAFQVVPTLHDFKYPLLYIIVRNVPLIWTLVSTLKNICETLSTDLEGWLHATGIIL